MANLSDGRCVHVTLLALEEASDPLDAQVVALCCPTGKDDVLFLSADQVCDALPPFLDGRFRLPAVSVRLGVRVPVRVRHEGQHGVEHARIGRRRRLHVEVDGSPEHRLGLGSGRLEA